VPRKALYECNELIMLFVKQLIKIRHHWPIAKIAKTNLTS